MRERFTAVLACAEAAERPNRKRRTHPAALPSCWHCHMRVLPQPAFEPLAEPDSSSTVYFNDDENAYLKPKCGRTILAVH